MLGIDVIKLVQVVLIVICFAVMLNSEILQQLLGEMQEVFAESFEV